jgi:hypothetical protein
MTPNNPAPHEVGNAHVVAVSLQGLDLPQWVDSVDAASEQADPRALLAHLLALDVAALPEDYDVVEVIAGWERLRAWVEARRTEALVEFARRGEASERLPRGEVARPFPAEELAPRLSVSPRIAAGWLTTAVALQHRLPGRSCGPVPARSDFSRQSDRVVPQASSVQAPLPRRTSTPVRFTFPLRIPHEPATPDPRHRALAPAHRPHRRRPRN